MFAFSPRLGLLPLGWVGAQSRVNKKAPGKEGHLVKILPRGVEQDADLCTGCESQAKALRAPSGRQGGDDVPSGPSPGPGYRAPLPGSSSLRIPRNSGALGPGGQTLQCQHLSLELPGAGEDRRSRTSGRNFSFREVCLQPDNRCCCLPAAVRQALAHFISFHP